MVGIELRTVFRGINLRFTRLIVPMSDLKGSIVIILLTDCMQIKFLISE